MLYSRRTFPAYVDGPLLVLVFSKYIAERTSTLLTGGVMSSFVIANRLIAVESVRKQVAKLWQRDRASSAILSL